MMDIREFQRIVLRLSNQMHVRHYLWLNYPHEPQVMALSLIDWRGHRGVMTDGSLVLKNELKALGFHWDGEAFHYAISRKDNGGAV